MSWHAAIAVDVYSISLALRVWASSRYFWRLLYSL